jgi:hypothetical protein
MRAESVSALRERIGWRRTERDFAAIDEPLRVGVGALRIDRDFRQE